MCNIAGSLSQPKVVTDVEDEELRTQMEELRMQNQEVAGDDDLSDEDDIPLENDESSQPQPSGGATAD